MSHQPRNRSPLAQRALLVCFALILGWCALHSPVAAQEPYPFTVSASGMVGGAFDASGDDPGLDQTGFQLGFAWDTWDQTRVVVRAARIAFSDEQLEELFDSDLSFVTVGGEYAFRESFYTSALYFGLGLYQIDGLVGLESQDDSSLGFVLGATGDFPLNDRFSILVELSGHYTDLELGAQFYGFLNAGVAFHF